MESGGIRAGEAFVEVGTKNAPLEEGLNRAKAMLRGFGAAIAEIGVSFSALGGAILAPLAASAKSFAEVGSQLGDMSARTGVSVEALSRLGYAAKQSGATLEDVEVGVKKMQKALGAAAGGSEEAQQALAKLGLSVSELAGLSPEKQFDAIAHSLASVENPTEKAAIALQIFGKSGTMLLPMIGELDQLRQQADKLGVVMTTETAASAHKLDDAFMDLRASVQAVENAVGKALSATLTDVAERTALAIGQVTRWISRNMEMVITALKVGAALTVAGGAVTAAAVAVLGLSKLAAAGAAAMTAFRIATSAAMVTINGLAAAIAVNPLGMVLTFVGAALTSYAVVSAIAGRSTRDLSDQYARLREEGDRAREGDLEKSQRLETLAKRQRLTSNEMNEARRIIHELQSVYGDIAITVNGFTQSLLGAEAGIRKLNEGMRAQSALEISKEIEEARDNLKKLDAQAKDMSSSRLSLADIPELVRHPLDVEQYVGPERMAALDANLKQQEGIIKTIDALQTRMRELRAGITAAATGTKTADGGVVPLDVVESEKAREQREKLAKLDEEALHKLHEARVATIEDERTRAIAGVEEKYRDEIKRMEEAGAAQTTLDKLAEARALDLVRVQREHDKRQYAERLQAYGEIYGLQTQAAIDAAKAGASGIENDLARQRRMIEIEHRFELEAIDNKWRTERQLADLAHDRDKARIADAIAAEAKLTAEQRYRLRLAEHAAEVSGRNRDQAHRNEDLEQDILLQRRGNTQDSQLRRLEFERERALKEAHEGGLNERLVEREFELRRQAILAAGNELTRSTTGTFNPAALDRIGGGTPYMRRTAEGIEKLVQLIQRGAQFPVFG
jgi:hypothetical protein